MWDFCPDDYILCAVSAQSPNWGAGGAPTGARYEGRVRGWAGPWPVVERWWEAGGGGHRRAHLQVELDDAPALLLTLTGGAWQVDGVYD